MSQQKVIATARPKGRADEDTPDLAEQTSAERFQLTPEQAAALVSAWDTNGDERTGDLILLCRALTYDRDRAEDILMAIEKEKMLHSPALSAALDRLVEQRRRAWQKEGAR